MNIIFTKMYADFKSMQVVVRSDFKSIRVNYQPIINQWSISFKCMMLHNVLI